MFACANCHAEMLTKTVALQGTGASMPVGACTSCSLLWFDDMASVRLAPAAVIELFRFISATGTRQGVTLSERLACASCARPLLFTHDVQRTTRFTYWRCERDRGQLITFMQFLRQKNFVRTPGPAELATLRQTVRQVTCTQCGAPIDLATDSACAHCGSVVSLVDPDGVMKALEAWGAEAKRATPDPETLRKVLADANADALLARARAMEESARQTNVGYDLVAIGLGALGSWLADQLIGD